MGVKSSSMRPSDNSEHKDKILKRLTRAEGQVRGISRMVAEDKYCIDVITQIAAVQAALDKTALELIRQHARTCLQSNDSSITAQSLKADELVAALSRLLSR